MAMKHVKKSLLILSGAMLSFSGACHALPFNIVPMAGTSLPTEILPGQTISALYTITNNTGSTRAGNFMKYLPPNTTQVPAGDYPNMCGSSFALQAHGTSGDSCNLLLNITGAVNGNDPDPHHHLFACFPGGLTCAGTNFPLNVAAVNNSNALVAAGMYDSNIGFAVSNNAGISWSQQVLALPSGVNDASALGVSCSGKNCVSAVTYGLSSSQAGGFAISHDGGNSWMQQILALPSGFNNSSYQGVTCSANKCIAVGSLTSTSTSQQEFAIAISLNNGATWTQQGLSLLPTYVAAQLGGISCNNNFCVASGVYNDNSSASHSAFAITTNGGNTWSQTALPLPAGYVDAQTQRVSCNGTLCVGASTFFDGTNNIPAVTVSNNSGASWTQQAISLPVGFAEGELDGVSCTSGSHCVVVGYFSVAGGSDAASSPAIVTTNNAGNTWSVKTLAVPTGYTSGEFIDVSCTGNVCTTVGGYDSAGFVTHPGVAISTDGGVNWTQQVLPIPTGYSSGKLYGIS